MGIPKKKVPPTIESQLRIPPLGVIFALEVAATLKETVEAAAAETGYALITNADLQPDDPMYYDPDDPIHSGTQRAYVRMVKKDGEVEADREALAGALRDKGIKVAMSVSMPKQR